MPQDPVIYSSNLQSGLTIDSPLLTGSPKIQEGFVDVTAALTLNAADHAGRLMRWNVAAGVTITLPAATGTGNRYRFCVNTTVTSAQDRIAVTGNDTFFGSILVHTDADCVADSVVSFTSASGNNQITLNGSTQGGIAGDYLEVIDIALDRWLVVNAAVSATGTEATQFATV